MDLTNWRFEVGGSISAFKGTPLYRAPTLLEFATPIELLQYLADHDDTHDSAIQRQIQHRLKGDAVALLLHRQRSHLRLLPHFRKYRQTDHYERYHAAADAVLHGHASSKQMTMVQGLDNEIASSAVVVPAGQMLFHGRGDPALHDSSPYPTFVSTSLDPIVCAWHAVKRKIQGGSKAKALIYALTLNEPLPAIWGNGGRLKEWELLLPRNLTCIAAAIHRRQRFDVIEATLRR